MGSPIYEYESENVCKRAYVKSALKSVYQRLPLFRSSLITGSRASASIAIMEYSNFRSGPNLNPSGSDFARLQFEVVNHFVKILQEGVSRKRCEAAR